MDLDALFDVWRTEDLAYDVLLRDLGLSIDGRRQVAIDHAVADHCYIHHTLIPVAVVGYTLASPQYARGRLPDVSFLDMVLKRGCMDEREVYAFSALCGIDIDLPYAGGGRQAQFGKFLREIIVKYDFLRFFEKIDFRIPDSEFQYRLRPICFKLHGDALREWRRAYARLAPARKVIFTTIFFLYLKRDAYECRPRGVKGQHAVSAIQDLLSEGGGAFEDWARLYALQYW